MEPARTFVRAWFAWKRHPRPTDAFDAGRQAVPEHGLESDIDHLSTWVYQLGTAHLGQKRRDFVKQALDLSREVSELMASVREAAVSPIQHDRYVSYLRATQEVLDTLRLCHEASSRQTRPPS